MAGAKASAFAIGDDASDSLSIKSGMILNYAGNTGLTINGPGRLTSGNGQDLMLIVTSTGGNSAIIRGAKGSRLSGRLPARDSNPRSPGWMAQICAAGPQRSGVEMRVVGVCATGATRAMSRLNGRDRGPGGMSAVPVTEQARGTGERKGVVT